MLEPCWNMLKPIEPTWTKQLRSAEAGSVSPRRPVPSFSFRGSVLRTLSLGLSRALVKHGSISGYIWLNPGWNQMWNRKLTSCWPWSTAHLLRNTVWKWLKLKGHWNHLWHALVQLWSNPTDCCWMLLNDRWSAWARRPAFRWNKPSVAWSGGVKLGCASERTEIIGPQNARVWVSGCIMTYPGTSWDILGLWWFWCKTWGTLHSPDMSRPPPTQALQFQTWLQELRRWEDFQPRSVS